jgi:Lrp/AsnC family transcriptional regulator, involved in the regulation of lysine biosynthesis
MDEKDLQILDKLKQNARMPFLRIALEMKVSEGTIRKRVANLIKQGIIKRFTVETSYDVRAIVEVTTKPDVPTDKIAAEIKKIGVDKIFEVAGRVSLLCRIQSKSLKGVNDIIEAIRQVNGVVQTETMPVLKEDL